jgi:hypothetical protein
MCMSDYGVSHAFELFICHYAQRLPRHAHTSGHVCSAAFNGFHDFLQQPKSGMVGDPGVHFKSHDHPPSSDPVRLSRNMMEPA